MQYIKFVLLCAVPLAAVLPAQSGVTWIDQDSAKSGLQKWKLSAYFTRKPGPGTKKSMRDITKPAPIWTTTTTTATLRQVSMGKKGIGGLRSGEFHMCLTVTNLNSAYRSCRWCRLGGRRLAWSGRSGRYW